MIFRRKNIFFKENIISVALDIICFLYKIILLISLNVFEQKSAFFQ